MTTAVSTLGHSVGFRGRAIRSGVSASQGARTGRHLARQENRPSEGAGSSVDPDRSESGVGSSDDALRHAGLLTGAAATLVSGAAQSSAAASRCQPLRLDQRTCGSLLFLAGVRTRRDGEYYLPSWPLSRRMWKRDQAPIRTKARFYPVPRRIVLRDAANELSSTYSSITCPSLVTVRVIDASKPSPALSTCFSSPCGSSGESV